MGTNTSSLQHTLDEYNITQTDPNNISIIRHKTTDQIYCLKQTVFNSQQSMNKFLYKTIKKKELTHQHYLDLKDVFEQSQSTFCSTLFKITQIYKYGTHTLQDEMKIRIQQNRKFEQKQLWSILCSITLVLNFLKNHKIQYKALSLNDIIINKQGSVKIVDPNIVKISNKSYCSPESLNGKHNSSKSIVFSFGMCLLQIILMETLTSCYYHTKYQFNQQQLILKLNKLHQTNIKNQSLINIIQTMLQYDVMKRITLSELEQSLFLILQEKSENNSVSQIGIIEKKQRDEENLNKIFSNILHPMLRQKQQLTSQSKQILQEYMDQQNPDKEDKQQSESILTERTNIYKSNKKTDLLKGNNYKLKNITYSDSYRDKHDNLFTNPNLLKIIRKDIQQMNISKTKQLDISQDFLSKDIQNATVNKNEISSIDCSKISNTQFKYVSQNYAKGRYQGQKKGSVRQGFGTFYYNQGGQYSGNWKNNKMYGKGTLYYQNNKIAYEGDWIQDHLYGYGTLYNQDPKPLKSCFCFQSFDQVDQFWYKYEGQFVQDNKCGHGKLYLINNETFQGDFYNDMVHGHGIFITINKQIIRGQWRQNKLLKKQ